MSKDYKNTLNLPETSFPMKANLPQKEPKLLDFWQQIGLYQKMAEKNKANPDYILHDGPPYANGHLHLGHALNKILKDIIVKYKVMKGFYAPYVPGWDCHGLPIEHEVDKKLGSKKHSMSQLDKRKECRVYASKFVDIQREEFKRLGVAGTWESPYLTMTPGYEASIVRELHKVLEAGYVYKGKKPVHWCPSCVTALAEAEVEYSNKASPSVYVAFEVERRFDVHDYKTVYIVIWTTTPWTLPANEALAVNPDVEYVAIEQMDDVYIVAKPRLEALRALPALSSGKIIVTFKGRELEHHYAHHPFRYRKSLITLGDFVSTEDGTGVVHIAPGHGEDDYEIGKQYKLDIYAPVDDRGRFTADVEGFAGQQVFQANKGIIELLQQKGALLHQDTITHSYPHCWRCKEPVIFRATEQWFISMEHENLRKKALSEIERVQWIPDWGKNRIFGMVKSRPDWCISRQRAWGVPIAVLECKSCGKVINDSRVLAGITEAIEKHGAEVWFTASESAFIPQGFECPHCQGQEFVKETDILDVWFESGVSHAAVLESDQRLSWPAALYLEGSDQHRGWFQSSLLASAATRGRAPFDAVLTHGFVVDGHGRKMSKSTGNVISPQEIIKQHGAEILRVWASAADYRDDMRISNEILGRVVEAYRKVRNTCRFLLGNISGFPPETSMHKAQLLEIDRFAMSKLQSLIHKVSRSYETFAFHEVFHSLYQFCVLEMSSFYLDILKDRLYVSGTDSPERRAAQWTMREILLALTKMMSPIFSFTAEEIWQTLQGQQEESVFLADFPVVNEEFSDPELEKKWDGLVQVRDEVNKALEIKRKEKLIGNSLEASVTIQADGEIYNRLKEQEAFLATLFIVSSTELIKGTALLEGAFEAETVPGLKTLVQRAEGQKCERCWNWSVDVGTEYPEICGRCVKVVSALTSTEGGLTQS